MTLANTCRDDLLPIAETISQEIELCCAMAEELNGQWNNETNQLLAFTLSSGISQLLHLQRAIQLEILEAEHAQRVASTIHAGPI